MIYFTLKNYTDTIQIQSRSKYNPCMAAKLKSFVGQNVGTG